MDSYSSCSELAVNLPEMKSSEVQPNILYENRYCNQDDFSILICGGKNENNTVVNSIFQMYGPQLKMTNYMSGISCAKYYEE